MIPPYRKYGAPPFKTVLIHGGPGAPGTMEPLAELLSEASISNLEHLQLARSIEGLKGELTALLGQEADPPVVLVGHSWGAMLALLFAAEFPDQIGKLVLVASAVFDPIAAERIKPIRLARLPDDDRARARALMEKVKRAEVGGNQAAWRELGALYDQADAFDPLTLDTGLLQVDAQQNEFLWREARELRASGELLRIAEQVRCKVVAIHGDYDPHPAAGVERPLGEHISDFEFVMLENCGHIPWLERQARDRFLELLLQHVE